MWILWQNFLEKRIENATFFNNKGEKPFICNFCDTSFFIKFNMNKHINEEKTPTNVLHVTFSALAMIIWKKLKRAIKQVKH